MAVPLFQRAYCWGHVESLMHKASCHSAGRMTSLVDGWWRDVAGEGVGVPAAQCREGHPQARYRDRGAVLCLGGQQRCTANVLLLASIQDAALRLLGIYDALPHKACFSLSLSIPSLSQSLCLSLSVSLLLMANYQSPLKP